jgi:hypothetical protein
MDPFSALSIAASVFQFVDFASTLFKDYREICQAGQPLTFEAFEQTTNDILKLNSTMKIQTQLAREFTGQLADHEQVRNSH